MHLVFDIFQGIGVAAAVGIRPFLPALVVGALAAGDVQIDFNGTGFAFLQHVPFLIVMVVGVILLALLERRRAPAGGAQSPSGPAPERREIAGALAVAGLVLGALLFAGALAQDHNAPWPGYIAGVLCAAVGVMATRPLFARVRARLDASTRAMLPLFAEAGALLLAALSVLLPPVGIVGLAGLLWLLVAGRSREQQKYAGLRILR